MKRSLVLAGGGAKIGWASGALQVLLEEADMRFDHYDATSGSVFNLGMLLSGRSAAHICEAWANLSPKEFVSFHSLWSYLRFWELPSLLTQEAALHHILPKWGIDLQKVRECREVYGHPCAATFNIVDFKAKRVKTLPNQVMDLDYFLAVDAVPGVVPPIVKDGTLYTDAMLLKDANLSEAVRRGADEIWVIWTVEDATRWRGGFWNHFGHIFETCALGNLRRELDEIEAMNQRVASGNVRPGDRNVKVHLLRPDQSIPVDYLFFTSQKQMPPIIESGRAWTRKYLRELGMPLRPQRPAAPPNSRGMKFTETMRGFWYPGESNHDKAYRLGRDALSALEFTLTIEIEDVDRFVVVAEHKASISGVVRSPSFDGTCAVVDGSFNLFRQTRVDTREMHYDVEFLWRGKAHRLRGFKVLRNDPGFDLWSDTTTLYVELFETDSETSLGSGILHIELADFVRQLASIRGLASDSALSRVASVARFGKFFFGGLWDTYGPAVGEVGEPSVTLMSAAEVDASIGVSAQADITLASTGTESQT